MKNIQRAKPKAKITVGGSGRRGNISDPSALKDKVARMYNTGQFVISKWIIFQSNLMLYRMHRQIKTG